MDFYAKKGEWALVIGASSGYGKNLAYECAKKGFNVIICARSVNKLKEVAETIKTQYGVEAREFAADISKEEVVDIIMDQIKDLNIACCIYNAAVENAGHFVKMDEKYHRVQIIGNVLNPMLIAYRVGRQMCKNHRGYLLLCGSIGGSVGTANSAVYSGCKAFMNILGESLWYEMAKYGVYAAGITIGAVVTPNMNAAQEKAEADKGERLNAGEAFTLPKFDFDITPVLPYLQAPPHTPEEAAVCSLEKVGEGPRLFSHPLDETGYYAIQSAKREIGVKMMGMFTDMYFSSGTSEFDAPDADEFVEIS